MKKIALFFVILTSFLSVSVPILVFARGHHHWHGPDLLFVPPIIPIPLPPPPPFYPPPPPSFYPPVGVVMPPPPAYEVVQQPTMCVDERKVSGQWEQDPDTGAKVWRDFAYPMKKKFYVPCN